MKRFVMATAALSGLLLTAVLAGSAQEQPKGQVSVREQLARKVKFGPLEDPKFTLDDLITQLKRIHDLNIYVNEAAFRADDVQDVTKQEIVGMGGDIKEMTQPLGRIVDRILTRLHTKSGAIYILQDDGILLTTNAAFHAEHGLKGDEPIGPLVQENFEAVSLTEALKQIGNDCQATILIDPRGAEKAAPKVITAQIRNTPLRTAVCLLADMAGLDMIKMDNVFYVSSIDHIQKLKQEQEKTLAAQSDKKAETGSQPAPNGANPLVNPAKPVKPAGVPQGK